MLTAAVAFAIVTLMSPSQLLAFSVQLGGDDTAGSMQTSEFPERDEDRAIRVYDKADILTESEELALENDLNRASGLEVELLVYTRLSDDSREDSQAFADRLRAEWSVGSDEGADNGLVYLISVGSSTSATDTMVISSGANTFPIQQLDQGTFQDIFENEVTPQIEEGEFHRALQFGVRRVLNYANYTPPDPRRLSTLQEHFRFASVILAAGLLQLAAIGYFLVPAIRERRISFLPTTRSLAIYAMAIGFLAVGCGIVAIIGRSTFGSLASLGVVIWAGCIVPLLIEWLARSRNEAAAGQHAPERTPAIG